MLVAIAPESIIAHRPDQALLACLYRLGGEEQALLRRLCVLLARDVEQGFRGGYERQQQYGNDRG
jgi:hypothetical protein